MKRTCLVLMLMAGLIATVSGQTRRAGNARPTSPSAVMGEQALKNLEHQLNDAFKNKDRVSLLRLLDDQYTFTDGGF